jgi:hypothetical protein
LHVRAIASRVALVLAAAEIEPAAAFDRFDTVGRGALTARMVHAGLAGIGIDMSKEQLDALVNFLDLDGDGEISESEFVQTFSLDAAEMEAVDPQVIEQLATMVKARENQADDGKGKGKGKGPRRFSHVPGRAGPRQSTAGMSALMSAAAWPPLSLEPGPQFKFKLKEQKGWAEAKGAMSLWRPTELTSGGDWIHPRSVAGRQRIYFFHYKNRKTGRTYEVWDSKANLFNLGDVPKAIETFFPKALGFEKAEDGLFMPIAPNDGYVALGYCAFEDPEVRCAPAAWTKPAPAYAHPRTRDLLHERFFASIPASLFEKS